MNMIKIKDKNLVIGRLALKFPKIINTKKRAIKIVETGTSKYNGKIFKLNKLIKKQANPTIVNKLKRRRGNKNCFLRRFFLCWIFFCCLFDFIVIILTFEPNLFYCKPIINKKASFSSHARRSNERSSKS